MNYTKRAALLCCTCYLVLLLLSLVPPQEIFGMELRRANILSELFSFSADSAVSDVELVIDEEEYKVDLEEVEQKVVAIESEETTVERNFKWSDNSAPAPAAQKPTEPARLLKSTQLTPIENFEQGEQGDLSRLSRLYRKLLSPDSLVRIAVLGDSFIEADIVTADLRESLQNQYGGCGAGFAPIHSPLTQYRSTIKTSAEGWSSHNVMQHRKTPEPYASLFSVSGWVSLPSNGASTTWNCTDTRDNLDSCQCVRLHFISLNDSQVEVSINGDKSRTFNIEGGEVLRQIELHQNNIRSLTMRVVSGADGFVGYGAIFEGESGVVVDNYSVRSNNGQAMFWTAPAINAQIDKSIGGYDLVILQYGLNIMQSGVNKYTAYAEQVEKMISYSQKCFPNAAIVVMGVSDRSTKKDGGEYQPMSEAKSLTEYQRSAAQQKGVCFWDTYASMRAQGGMSRFVEQGWAGKDYTHINFAGGRQMAWALVDAITEGVDLERQAMVEKVDYEPIIDSISRSKIEERLFE